MGVATIVAFQVSADDASRLGREMHRTRTLCRLPGATRPDSLDVFFKILDEYLERCRVEHVALTEAAREQVARDEMDTHSGDPARRATRLGLARGVIGNHEKRIAELEPARAAFSPDLSAGALKDRLVWLLHPTTVKQHSTDSFTVNEVLYCGIVVAAPLVAQPREVASAFGAASVAASGARNALLTPSASALGRLSREVL